MVWDAPKLGLPATGRGDGKYALEAILAASDMQTEMNASRIRIQAQRNGFGQALPKGVDECTECSRVSVDPVPEGTQSVAMSLVLQAGVTAGTVLVGALLL